MKKLKLRPFVLPTLVLILAISTFALSTYLKNTSLTDDSSNYVDEEITGEKIPTINETTTIINPYNASDVKIGKTFYDYKADEKEQTSSITKYDDTYMQNSGVDFISDNAFDVLAILDGEVVSVTEEETLGKVVKIQHSNDYISVYQSLSEVNVKKGDKVVQGQVIGKSGKNKMEEDLGNHLHFELYISGQMVNPTDYLNKDLNVSDKKE